MKSNGIKVFFICLLLLFFFGMIGIFLTIYGIDKVKEADTASIAITVRNISVQELGENASYIIIDTYEYNYPFRLPGDFTEQLQSNKLQTGSKVYLKIPKSKKKELNKSYFIDAVSLYYDDEVFVSIDEYNQIVHNDIFPARVAAITASFGFFIAAVLMMRSLVKTSKREKILRQR